MQLDLHGGNVLLLNQILRVPTQVVIDWIGDGGIQIVDLSNHLDADPKHDQNFCKALNLKLSTLETFLRMQCRIRRRRRRRSRNTWHKVRLEIGVCEGCD